jgi:hypothetical protein
LQGEQEAEPPGSPREETRGGGTGERGGGSAGFAGPAGTKRMAPSVPDPRGRGPRERARGGHGRGELLEMADMSGVFSNFVKKFVWGYNT